MKKVNKATIWSAPICALVAAVTLTTPGTATAAAQPASKSASAAFSGRLYSVAAISAGNAWAAGLGPAGTLILHWDGTAWSQSLTGPGFLIAMADSSAGDVWAVGGTNWFSPGQPLVDHWDGSSWTQVSTPSPAGGGYLDGVAATSPQNAWAVGTAGTEPGNGSSSTPLIEHWDGRKWTTQKYQVPAQGGYFGSVAATSPHDAWAVGGTNVNSDGSQQILIEHWNGMCWHRVTSPKVPGSSAATLAKVTIISSNDAWAVGQAIVGDSYETVTMHWNGRCWHLVPSPMPPTGGVLLGVAASGADNVWAVGQAGQHAPFRTIIEHWDGHRWTLIPSPNPPSGYLNSLFSVSIVRSTDIWAVGTTDYASTLILHWNGTSWS